MNTLSKPNRGESTLRGLDETDRRILRVLQAEPDLPVAQLSERVGLSQTPCWRRLKRLKADGWKLVENQGYKYWSQRRYERRT